MTALVPLSEIDPDAVERLLDAAFGTDRHERTAYRVRAGMHPISDLSLAVLNGSALLGVLQCWPVALVEADRHTPLILVGPVAVAPDHQNQGTGRAMMTEMLRRAEQSEPLVLIGDPEYYGLHFGFTADATTNWELPGPFVRRRLLARTGGRDLPYRGMLGPRL